MASGFVALGGIDLDDIFATRTTTKTHNVQYYIEGVDISNRYEKLTTPPLAQVTGYEWHGADLNTIFQAKNSPIGTTAYRFVDAGSDALTPIDYPASQQVAVSSGAWDGNVFPYLVCEGVVAPAVAGARLYPTNIVQRGITSQPPRYSWLDSLTIPAGTQDLLNDLWATLDPNAIPPNGEGLIDYSGSNIVPSPDALTINLVCSADNFLPEDYITSVTSGSGSISYVDLTGALVAVGTPTDIESFWAMSTTAAKAVGIYSGINQVAWFPLVGSATTTLSLPLTFSVGAECMAAPVSGNIPIGGAGFGYGGSVSNGALQGEPYFCFSLYVGCPTLLVERLLLT